jgi:hypothetical protein
MIEFSIGVCVGIYIGTVFDCRPAMELIVRSISKYLPEKRSQSDPCSS